MSIEKRIEWIKSHRDKDIPMWGDLVKEYDKKKHEVHKGIKFTEISSKHLVKVDYGGQKLMVDRMVQMINTIPIERVYSPTNEEEEEAQKIIEAVYADNKIHTENNRRLHAYFASCEVATMWTGIPQSHNRYGEKCETRLKCHSFSPMDRKYSMLSQAEIYPVFDDFMDMTGIGIGGKNKKGEDFLSYYTNSTIERYTKINNVWVCEKNENKVGKIPFSYLYRFSTIYDGQTGNIDTIETIESSQGQVIKRNSAPVMWVKGMSQTNWASSEQNELERKTGVPREIYELQGENSGIGFVDTPIDADAPDRMIKRIKALIEEEAQLPLSLTLDSLQGLGNVSGEARKQLLMGAHLKVGQEEGEVISFLDREMRVVKELLAIAMPKYKEAIHNIKVSHKVTPFVMDDEIEDLNKDIAKLNNGLASRVSIMRKNGEKNPEKIFNQVLEENNKIQASLPDYL